LESGGVLVGDESLNADPFQVIPGGVGL